MTVYDNRISREAWRQAWYYYRSAPSQAEAIDDLYDAICNLDPCLMSEHSWWFKKFYEYPNLVKSVMYPEGQ